MNQNILNYNPPASPDVGTSVLEVDSNGNPTGKVYVARYWNTRCRPTGRTDGCPQWIDTLIVADTVQGAQAGRSLLPASVPAASSSPSSRDVTVIYVDSSGSKIRQFTKGYLFVPYSTRPASGSGEAEANEMWISDVRIDRPEVAAAERQCNGAGPGSCS